MFTRLRFSVYFAFDKPSFKDNTVLSLQVLLRSCAVLLRWSVHIRVQHSVDTRTRVSRRNRVIIQGVIRRSTSQIIHRLSGPLTRAGPHSFRFFLVDSPHIQRQSLRLFVYYSLFVSLSKTFIIDYHLCVVIGIVPVNHRVMFDTIITSPILAK